MQPGVEFHLRLDHDCDLGGAGRWWGWQCRWYGLPSGTQLGNNRRQAIIDAIAKSETHLPGLTDWVLWTRRPLTPTDVEWFESLNAPFTLHRWAEAEVEDFLAGEASVLRSTYFGELVLTPAILAATHARAVAPIKKRWDPAVHIEVEVERFAHQILGDPAEWTIFREGAEKLKTRARDLEGHLDGLSDDGKPIAQALIEDLDHLAERADLFPSSFDSGRPDIPRILREDLPVTRAASRDVRNLARKLRALSNPAALSLAAGLGSLKRAVEALDQAHRVLGLEFLAVVGLAGRGKTYFAAQLTAPTATRPAGLFIPARPLTRQGTLDDLAKRVPGITAETFDQLLEAIDAAGARAGCRLPIVIDGLNESEDPRTWHDLLAMIQEALTDYDFVVVFVTVRPNARGYAIPEDTPATAIRGFRTEVEEAVARYFEYYLIDPGDAPLPYDRFANPLFLRTFCEATNPNRERWVGVEAIPASLVDVFERYRDVAVERVASDLSMYEGDVLRALDDVANALWEREVRTLPFDELRALVGDGPRDWDKSLARALEEEGVLSRDLEDPRDAQFSSLMFDSFAGFLIADVLIRRLGSERVQEWISDPANSSRLDIESDSAHALADDVLSAMAALLPRKIFVQLWSLLEGTLRAKALAETADLEGRLIDAPTRNELLTVVVQPPAPRARDLLDRLRVTRSLNNHPLNANFLEDALRPLAVHQRDLRWSEWVRRRHKEVQADIRQLEERWKEEDQRLNADALSARWVAWTLTSSIRKLRDEATRALYWFGRGEPSNLFQLALEMIDVNDPYVADRLLAASYGVAMANLDPDDSFRRALAEFLSGLQDQLLIPDAQHPTQHWLIRDYVGCLFELAEKFHAVALPRDENDNPVSLDFADPAPISPIERDDPRAEECDRTFGMDFENYTVGRLVDDRANYDMEHHLFQDALAQIRGRVWDLGWREEAFAEIDSNIAELRWPRQNDPETIERYGKKYGWIGFWETAGRFQAEGHLTLEGHESYRLSDADIDPSFPDQPPRADLSFPTWVRPTPKDDKRWVRHGIVRTPPELLRPQHLESQEGPWLLVNGFLRAKDRDLGRQVFGIMKALLVAPEDVNRLIDAFESVPHPGSWFFPSEPSDYYTFSGEIPWSKRFAAGAYAEDPSPYTADIGRGEPITAEILNHYYSWESYHSALNQAGSSPVPSAALSRQMKLRPIPQSLDQIDDSGHRASLTLAEPEQFDSGHLLYIREDVVRSYAETANLTLVWLSWGERELEVATRREMPGWLANVMRSHADVWRQAVSLGD